MFERIVVWDPSGKYPEGTLVQASTQQALDELAGVATLPIDRGLLELGPVAGYFRRGWGYGERYERSAPRRGCPMALHVVPDFQLLHWVARVVPVGGRPSGHLRLASVPSRFTSMTGGLSAAAAPVVLAELGEPDRWGGWTVRRSVEFACSSEGLICVAIQGVAERCAVLWSAVSQSSRGD